MSSTLRIDQLRRRQAALEMTEDEFRSLGHDLVDRIAGFLASTRGRAVTPAEPADKVRTVLGATRELPQGGKEAAELLESASDLLFEHSLLNGHPRFYGYITSSAAPIGMLAELLASSVNANVGAWKLSPMATEIEAQTIRWLAQFIGYPTDCGGLLLSGGNMANLTCFLAARAAKAGWDVRKQGTARESRLVVYASKEAHTWIQKAADLTGLGTEAIRWIGIDKQQRMDLAALEAQYSRDLAEGYQPFLVVGSAGTVSTGAVDPLAEIGA
ncbi:MAG: pyridoxal-dependent decarboxylase, partial [Bryobacteraceae bacterium]